MSAATSTSTVMVLGGDQEKNRTVDVERSAALEAFPDQDKDKTEEERKKIDRALIRKVDYWLVPWLAVLYCFCFICRTNIGNAKLQGMEAALGMSGIDYNISLTIFFIAYAFFDPITNAILKKSSPRVFFTLIMVVSGVIVTLTGLCTNYSGMLAARFFLGVAQSAFFPGVNYYLSCWYKASEIGLRSAIFFAGAALAGSFSGLLAFGIAKMDQVAGLAGWKWIFILEGIATFLAGVICWFMPLDWPSTAHFLSAEDRIRVQRRLLLDKQSAVAEHFDKRYVYEACKDWKTYGYMLIYTGCLMPLYAFALFLPTIIQGMGKSGATAQIMSVPPYACAAVFTIIVGYIADRTRWRGYCNIAPVLLAIAGFVILIATDDPNAQYAGTFLGAMGIYPTIPNSLSWVSNNTEGSLKRAIALGMVIGFGNFNGAVSSNIYMTKEKPRYWTGHATVLAYLVVCLLGGSILVHFALAAENKKRKNGERDAMFEKLSKDELLIKGDKRPDFIYTL
ncbi:unnamed protein product [Clonostachys rosea]|uniref:Major facilitator superfamily (MFS) profile domain-containing protein n=1 Tax=Bionectria ochroleuca TaxID=29856 RepID=A0ABY6UQ73_BIOOC|nr:unnamed protein product [Clonostachys rosea]